MQEKGYGGIIGQRSQCVSGMRKVHCRMRSERNVNVLCLYVYFLSGANVIQTSV